MRSQLAPLPAATAEVKSIQDKLPGLYLFESNASEATFKSSAQKYGMIHLAMHGILNEKEKALSALVFNETTDTTENNFLYAYEIAKMNLNAELVVLSACQTGLGKFEKGNGLASIARAFMYANIPSLIVSLWQVNDFSTAILMQNIYANLAKEMPKNKAIRQAKLSLFSKTITYRTLHIGPLLYSSVIIRLYLYKAVFQPIIT